MSNYREGKSGVNVKRLVQNIADQYPFEPQIAAVVELVANSLDAKASQIRIRFDQTQGILQVTDDGLGMDKRQFVEYHDFAASSKERGRGIGFAGQGAKLALSFCKKVITETWSSNYRGYSEWSLKGNDAPYRIFDGQVLDLDGYGTKATLHLEKTSVDFYTERVISDALIEHYYPLLDNRLKETEIYRKFYERGLRILLNDCELSVRPSLEELLEDRKVVIITVYHKPKAVGMIGRVQNVGTILPGIMISTYGKVIERTHFKEGTKRKRKNSRLD